VADEPLIDTHVHFFDHAERGLEWSWLRAGYTYRRWTASESIDRPRYCVPEFTADAAGSDVVGVVHGHSAEPIDDPAVETAWLERVADQEGLILGIVGRCALAAPDAPALIARHAAHGRFRGVRDPDAIRHLDPDAVAPALAACGRVGASVEMRRDHRELAPLRVLAGRWPEVTFALSHACLPLERTSEHLREWWRDMRRLAVDHPNVVCKISAVAGASDPRWTIDSIRPWILGSVEAFGARRCMLGSNWPVDAEFGSYRALIDAYREIALALDPAERQAVFHGTATRVYRLAAPT
jgi:predicted TIM-barrel fold metal-dependent hydrolase